MSATNSTFITLEINPSLEDEQPENNRLRYGYEKHRRQEKFIEAAHMISNIMVIYVQTVERTVNETWDDHEQDGSHLAPKLVTTVQK